MDLYEAIDKRRTIRKFKSPVTEEQLKKIISEGVKAPSAGNKQEWEFVLVNDSEIIKKISEIKYAMNRGAPIGEEADPEKEKTGQIQKDSFSNASLIVVYAKGEGNVSSAWVCIENMLLTAVAEGLATRIAGFWGEGIEEIDKLMNAPEEMKLVAAISVGVADQEPALRNLRPHESWLHVNKF